MAERLRIEIVSEGLRPGERIVEETRAWGGSGIGSGGHLHPCPRGLCYQGRGRSARVVNLSEKEVLDIYELRGALEGFGGAACDGEDGGSFWVAAAG